MNQVLGSLSILLNAKDQGLTQGLNNATRSLKTFAAQAAGIVGVGLSITGVYRGLKEAIDFGGRMTDLRDQTKETIPNLIIFRQALEETGVGGNMAVMMINMLKRSMSMLQRTKDGQSVIKDLGLDFKKLNDMSPVQQIAAVGEALGKMTDESRKAEIMMRMFGRAGYYLGSFFADPKAIEKVTKALGSFPKLVEKNANSFDALVDTMSRFQFIRLGLFTGIMEGLAPMTKTIINQINSLQEGATKLGQRIGRIVLFMVEVVKQGKIGELLGLQFQLAFAILSNHWNTVWDNMSKYALGKLTKLGAWIMSVFTTIISSLLASVQTAADGIAWALQKGFSKVGLSDDPGKFDFLQNWTDMYKWGQETYGGMADSAHKAADILTNEAIAGMKNVIDSPEVKGVRDQIDALVGGVMKTVEDRIAEQQGPITQVGPMSGGKRGEEQFMAKFAPTALRGSVEAYKAERGISDSSKKTAQNTSKLVDLMQNMPGTMDKIANGFEDLDLAEAI